jgi:predicted phosphate transport protein (TIGR00153 family)
MRRERRSGLVMLGWFQALMPKEMRFFDLFERHAAVIEKGAGAMQALLQGGDQVGVRSAQVLRFEDEADAVAAEVMLAVRRSFITPFDRGDIKDLIGSMDDAIDQMRQTAKAITLFEVTRFEPQMQELGAVTVKAARLTTRIVAMLRDMRKQNAELHVLIDEMRRLEEQSDELHDRGIKALYLASRASGAMTYIVGSEIYGHLEKIVDRFEDVANKVSGIMIENL